MKVTIYDVAKMARVSITTVSRVVNENYPVSEKTRRRVLRAIRESGYSPNHLARSLATNSTETLGVVGADLSNPYFAEMINAIQNEAAAHSLQILLQNTRDAQGEVKS